MKNPKLKTAKEAYKEIVETFRTEPMRLLGTGGAEFTVLGEKCYGEEQCWGIIKSNEVALNQTIGKYFMTDGGLIKDPIGNIYITKEVALDSIPDGFYNSRKRQELGKITERGFNG
jgi:hypothetical protein